MTGLLRAIFLWLSRQQAIGEALERAPFGSRLFGRFVAGTSHEAAIETAQPLIDAGFQVTFSLLGEDVETPKAAAKAVEEYQTLLGQLGQAGIAAQSRVAVKPTLLGLDLGYETAQGNLTAVLEAARWAGVVVELDMERSATVDDTLSLYRGAVAETPNLGIAVQAYLRRSRADVEKLIADGMAHIRLVKGAYAEPAEIVFENSAAVEREYRKLLRLLLEPASIKAGTTVAVATHDTKLLAGARTRTFRKATPQGRWEVQMLLGVRTSQQKRLLREGYPVRVYLPYGQHWYAYSMRRLAERPANLVFALRSIFSS